MSWVDFWPGRYELSKKLASLEQDEIGPQVRCCPFPLATPAMDSVLQDPQLLMILVAAAGLPTARACRAARKALGKELRSSMPVLYASAMPSIYVFGGACRNLGVLSNVMRLDAGGQQWQQVPAMPSARRLCSATACNGCLYVFGGEAVSLIPGAGFIPNSLNNLDGMLRDYMQLDNAERFDPLHGTWEVLPSMPTSRAGCAATTADGLIYVSGGRLGETVLNVFERFDPGIERWEVLPRVPTSRSGCSSATVKGRVYVLGGKCTNGRVQGVSERFHPSFGRWEKLQPMISPRSAFSAGVIADVIYAAGGFNGAIGLASVERFDPISGVWSETVAMNTPRVGGAAAVTGGCLYVFGGKSTEDLALAGESFDPLRQVWVKMPAMDERQVYCAGAAAVCACSPFSSDCMELYKESFCRDKRL
ncbi:unnamed protein product [Cladocopium goreaui]|uniref:Kelch-like protein 12 n=1 Tax=Cladocopium goreaui TaxID=2562237 RepID=A0A9P1G7R9_9DINO|nr:unnamed protein product [Cladocopium goreaui]